MPKRRNPVARSPLLRKGGAHQTSKSSDRARARKTVNDSIVQWQEAPSEEEHEDSPSVEDDSAK